MLKLIGYWRLPPSVYEAYEAQTFKWGVEPPDYPVPQQLIDRNWPIEDRQKIIEYLNAGFEFETYRGLSYCRFGCGDETDENLGCRDFTDGVWVWPEGLAHYVEVHSVRLPDKFLNHAAKNNFRMPESFVKIDTKVDHEFWITWAKTKQTL